MKIEFKSYKQERSMSCGQACIRMVLEYNGIHLSERDICKLTGYKSTGSESMVLATAILKQSFDIKSEAYSYALYLFSKNFKFNEEVYISNLRDIGTRNKLVLRGINEYLAANGRLFYASPTFSLIKSKIDKNIPCIISYSNAAIGRYYKSHNSGHYVVIIGYTKDSVIISDPDPWDNVMQYEVKIEDFIPAWVANNLRSPSFLTTLYK